MIRINRKGLIDLAREMWAGSVRLKGGPGLSLNSAPLDKLIAALVERWLAFGLQSVQTPHLYAAALMATNCSEHPFQLPWPAFEISVPSGLIEYDGQALESVLVSSMHGTETGVIAAMVFSAGISLVLGANTAEKFVSESTDFDGKLDEATGLIGNSQADRIATLVRRLVANVCLDITSNHQERIDTKSCSTPRVKRGQCVPSTFAIGSPLYIDCRPSISAYLNGARRSEPSVSTLVRGHWRNQVHGPSNSLRRMQWIQPFFRGDGPLLVRPTRLGRTGA